MVAGPTLLVEYGSDATDKLRFCDRYCELDHQEGYTPSQALRRRRREGLTVHKGHWPRRGGDPADTLKFLGSGLLKWSQLEDIDDEGLDALLGEIRATTREK